MVTLYSRTIGVGRQEGIGVYYLQNQEVKYGEWKEGKRVRWLGDEELEELKK